MPDPEKITNLMKKLGNMIASHPGGEAVGKPPLKAGERPLTPEQRQQKVKRQRAERAGRSEQAEVSVEPGTKPETEGTSKRPAVETKPKTELDKKLDEKLAENTKGSKVTFAECDIDIRIQVLETVLAEGNPEGAGKILLQQLQKVKELYDRRAQNITEQVTWQKLRGVISEQVSVSNLAGVHDREILQKMHQSIFTDIASHPSQYGVGTDQVADVVQTLNHATMAQCRRELPDDSITMDTRLFLGAKLQDVEVRVNEVFSEGVADHDDIKQSFAKFPIKSPRVLEYFEEGLEDGKSLVQVANEFTDLHLSPNQPFDNAESIAARKLMARFSVGLEDEGYKKVEIKGGAPPAPPKVYDASWTFPNVDVKAYLEELQNKIDNNPHFAGDARKIGAALDKVASFNASDRPTGGPNVVVELTRHYEELVGQKRGQGEGVTEQFSGLFLNARKRGLTVMYPKWTVNELYRKFNEIVTFNTRGQIPQHFERQISQVAEYYSNDQFQDDIRGMFENSKYLKAIEKATGVNLDDLGINGIVENHPFYKDRISACNAAKKEVADLMTAKENLTYSHGVIKSGEKFETIKAVLGELGDSGIFTIKGADDYITGVAYDMFDTIAGDLCYDWESGAPRRIGETEMDLLFETVVEVLTRNKTLLKKRFEEYWKAESSLPATGDYRDLEGLLHIDGGDREMNFGEGDERLRGIVREAQKLYTATLREVYARERSLSPGESRGPHGAPKYGAEEGIYQFLKGRRPVGFFIERWDLLDAAGRLHLNVMLDQYARLMGIDEAIESALDYAMGTATTPPDLAYKRELVKRALGVVEQTKEQEFFKDFFKFDLNGKKITPPISIDALTREQLKRLVLFKEGSKYADLVLGSYDYEGATWICHAKTTAFDLIYGSDSWRRGIGLGEIKRKHGGGLISAESHEDRKRFENLLIYGIEEAGDLNVNRGVLREYADYMPQRGFQDLMEHNHYGMRTEYRAMVGGGMFTDVFHERHIVNGVDEWRAVKIEPDKPSVVYHNLKPVHRMVDEFIAYGEHPTVKNPDGTPKKIDSSPINYATFDPVKNPDQDAWLTLICDEEHMHVDKDKYLKIMKRLSDYVGKKEQLLEMVKPQYLDTYTTVQDLDSREKFLDTPDKAPGTHYQRGTLATEVNIVKKASGDMGGPHGKSKMCGIARIGGDCGNASDNALIFNNMIGELSEKKLFQMFPEFANNVLFVYGNTWKHRAVGIVAGSWAKCAKMDTLKDWTLVGSFGALIESSPFRRVTHLTGEHGAPTKTLNELHHFWQAMQIEAGVTMVDAEWLNHFEEYELGLVSKSGSRAPWYLYTYSLAGALAALTLAVQLKKQASEGFAQGSGVSGDAHH